jgi:hypothetical protein
MATTLGNEEGFAPADLHISYYRPMRGGRLRQARRGDGHEVRTAA